MAENIRIATHDDTGRLIELLALRHREAAAWRGEFNAPLMQERILALLQTSSPGLVGIIDGVGGACATCGLIVAQFWDTGLKHLEPLWMFVHPDHRRTDYMKRLIEFAKGMADSFNLPLIGAEEQPIDTKDKLKVFGRTVRDSSSIKVSGLIFRHTQQDAVNG